MKTLSMQNPFLLRIALLGAAVCAALGLSVALAHADGNVTPTVSATAYNASGLNISSAPIGTSVHLVALVASTSASTSPSGTVDIKSYPNLSCTGTSSVESFSLVNGFATSSNTSLANTGLSYQVHYNGQGGMFTSADSACVAVSPTSTGITGTLSGTVYNDANHNETLDSGEAGIAGFTVNLYKNAGWWGKNVNKNPIATVVTDANGNYSFSNLAAGIYLIEEVKLAGWHQTTSDFRSVKLTSSAGVAGLNFGNIAVASSTPHGHGHTEGDNDNDDQGNGADHGNKGGNGNHFGWFKFWSNFNFGNWGKKD